MFSLNNVKFRTKLIIFVQLAIVVVLLASIYTYFSLQIIIRDTTLMYEKTMELTAVYRQMDSIQQEIQFYLSTNSSDSLISFYDYMNNIKGRADKLIKNVDYTPEGIKSKNAASMIINYLDHAEKAIIAKRGRDIDGYTSYYALTVEENNDIMRYIEEIISGELISTSDKYAAISKRVQFATTFNNLLIIVVIIFVTTMIISFSFQITKPITKLASYAKRVSVGDFDIEIQSVTGGEIGVLYKAFNLMVVSIKEYVNEIKEKARLEASLNEQRLHNLKMKNELREAELLALQSQINPHFIFNTINIGAKIAMLEGDKRTCTYLENAADIFRYNLRGLDTSVHLREEIENVCAYIYLLQTRFGDSVIFKTDYGDDPKDLNIIVPRMILQPIAENAYIHGISEMEEGGTIILKVESDEEYVYVYIMDNGKGMSRKKINELLGDNKDDDLQMVLATKRGHTTGIGIVNVINRLRLYYNRNDTVDIKCEDGLTKVIFKLPKNHEQGAENVSSIDS
ncbi:MAG: sensor histidine kinase [Acetivibrionales bacterium]|jgi:two-component system sensor histidine kinase YesM